MEADEEDVTTRVNNGRAKPSDPSLHRDVLDGPVYGKIRRADVYWLLAGMVEVEFLGNIGVIGQI